MVRKRSYSTCKQLGESKFYEITLHVQAKCLTVNALGKNACHWKILKRMGFDLTAILEDPFLEYTELKYTRIYTAMELQNHKTGFYLEIEG